MNNVNQIEISEVFDARKHQKFTTYSSSSECKSPFTFMINLGGYMYLPSTGIASQCGYTSEKEATLARDEMIFSIENGWFDDIVFAVLVNSDFTEGRGPMKLDRIFKSASKAHQYIMNEEGIYGSEQRQSLKFGVNIHGFLYGSVNYNGFEIKPMILE